MASEAAHTSPPVSTCPHCLVGSLRLQRVVYARWYGGHFITVPNFPSWVCDVCGSLEYDAAALDQMKMILGRESGAPPEAARRAGPGLSPAQSQPGASGRRRV